MQFFIEYLRATALLIQPLHKITPTNTWIAAVDLGISCQPTQFHCSISQKAPSTHPQHPRKPLLPYHFCFSHFFLPEGQGSLHKVRDDRVEIVGLGSGDIAGGQQNATDLDDTKMPDEDWEKTQSRHRWQWHIGATWDLQPNVKYITGAYLLRSANLVA